MLPVINRYLLITMLALALSACGPVAIKARPASPYKGPLRVSAIEKEIHRLINRERRGKGLGTLKLNSQLSTVARLHSEDMTARGYFSHDSPDGESFSERYKKGGFGCSVPVERNTYSLGAENIFTIMFTGSQTEKQIARDTVSGWMNSSGHRKNILTPHWGREGIGVSIGLSGQMVIVYITQNFC